MSESNDWIKFWLKEMLSIFAMLVGFFCLFWILTFQDSSKVRFYNPMNDVTNVANEAKDTSFNINKWTAPNDGYSAETNNIRKAYNDDTVAWSDDAIKSWDINSCFKRFEGNYDKAYTCIKSYWTFVDYVKSNSNLPPEWKKLYDIAACAYSTNYDDFNGCMKTQLFQWDSLYACLVFKEDDIQYECFNSKVVMFSSTRWMLEYFNIEQQKNKILFDIGTDGKIIRKKITSEILEDHPEFLMKYKFFTPKLENFAQLSKQHPLIFENKNFLKALKLNNILY